MCSSQVRSSLEMDLDRARKSYGDARKAFDNACDELSLNSPMSCEHLPLLALARVRSAQNYIRALEALDLRVPDSELVSA